MANLNVIEAAVNPLKTDAMNRAEKVARETIAHVSQELAAAGNDLRVCAPYPSSLNETRVSYMAKLSKYKLFQTLTVWRKASYNLHEAMLADMDPNSEKDFIEAARKDAAFQYEAFVAKLNKKIGKATAARLEGNHVWGHSYLFVTTIAGAQEIWKTQMIINVSKFGKLFNQFPTRKVKKAGC